MEAAPRLPQPRHQGPPGDFEMATTPTGRSRTARSRSDSPAPSLEPPRKRHAGRRSRSPLPSQHRPSEEPVSRDGEQVGKRRRYEKDEPHLISRYRECNKAKFAERSAATEDRKKRRHHQDQERSQYAYRSSHHIDDLRAARGRASRESSQLHRASKGHDASASLPRHLATGLQQASPSPSPPNATTTRFPPPDGQNSSRQDSRHRSREDPGRSPSRSRHSSSHHQPRARRRSSAHSYGSHDATGTKTLPFGSRTLSRWDFAAFEPLFAHYLELQKDLAIGNLAQDEVAGRWKSFVGKWNRGELAEGWYEPEMFLRVVRLRAIEEAKTRARGPAGAAGVSSGSDLDAGQVMTPPMTGTSTSNSHVDATVTSYPDHAVAAVSEEDEDGDSADEYGPAPPGSSVHQPRPLTRTQGPTVPGLQDIAVRQEQEAEERAARLEDLRTARKADRALQKERLDELAPRAEPGTRERQLEKKKLASEANKAFREASPDREVGERELMGGGDGVDDYKRMLVSMQKRKTERELRREEFARAREAEREERVAAYQEKEDVTMARLQELARLRFGTA